MQNKFANMKTSTKCVVQWKYYTVTFQFHQMFKLANIRVPNGSICRPYFSCPLPCINPTAYGHDISTII